MDTITNMTKGTKVKIKYYPKCSSSCKESCASCIVEADGKCTGRSWNPSDGKPLYEVKYKKQGQRKHLTGIFLERELELL